MNNESTMQIYTDGSCLKNPNGPGGWSVVLNIGDRRIHATGFSPNTTNNRMEMMAALSGIRLVKKVGPPGPIALHTDSEYVKKGMTEWIAGWKRRGWVTSGGKDVQNRDLWEDLDRESRGLNIEWRWVRGHAGDPNNELADKLARVAAHTQQAAYQEFSGEASSVGLQIDATQTRKGTPAIHLDLGLSDQQLAYQVRSALAMAKGKSVRFRQAPAS